MHRKFIYTASALFLVLASSFAVSQNAHGCSYADLNIKGFVTSINDNGTMVGRATDRPSAFLLANGKMTFFNFPGARGTSPSSISNTSQIVGSFMDPANGEKLHGFSVKSGVFHQIDFPGATITAAGGSNSQGDIVGGFSGSSVGNNGFLLRSGHFHVIHFPGANTTGAAAINKFGTIVGSYQNASGQHGFVLNTNGALHTINFPGAINTGLVNINDAGVIIGTYGIQGQNADHSFMLVKGKFITIDDPNALDTFASGLNNQHKFVGNYISKDGTRQPSFVATCPTVF